MKVKINSYNKLLASPLALSLVFMVFLTACGTDTQNNVDPINKQNPDAVSQTKNLSIPDNRFSNNYKIVLFGNSHVSGQANLIANLITTGNPMAQVKAVNAGGGYLDDKQSQQRRAELLNSEPWSHVILQGQKYSQSGITTYSTVEAQVWIATAKDKNITPILFPEHPHFGRGYEGRQVHVVHAGIAALEKACVAPVGLTWDKVLLTEPSLLLHLEDGNHASLMGSLLTALVFYEVITGNSADLLPYIANIDVDETTQQLLGQLASETIQANQPCLFE